MGRRQEAEGGVVGLLHTQQHLHLAAVDAHEASRLCKNLSVMAIQSGGAGEQSLVSLSVCKEYIWPFQQLPNQARLVSD